VNGQTDFDDDVGRAVDPPRVTGDSAVVSSGYDLLGRAGNVARRPQITIGVDERALRAHERRGVGIDEFGYALKVG